MRLTTAIWLGVFMRLESQRGAYVSVVKKGAQQAGTVFVVHLHRNGMIDVYGPAPQSVMAADAADRLFEMVLSNAGQPEVDAYLEKQMRFDPDLWIVESQGGGGQVSVDLADR